MIRARARHVVTENARVLEFAKAIGAGDFAMAGDVMDASHASLSGDFDCSTADIDQLCHELRDISGVYGARITGGGWGGCVVALAEPGALDPAAFPRAWLVQPAAGAAVTFE